LTIPEVDAAAGTYNEEMDDNGLTVKFDKSSPPRRHAIPGAVAILPARFRAHGMKPDRRPATSRRRAISLRGMWLRASIATIEEMR
jgi:hypothetical protein